jgi:hypothetical protein
MQEFSERILEHPKLFGLGRPYRLSVDLRLLDDNTQRFHYKQRS